MNKELELKKENLKRLISQSVFMGRDSEWDNLLAQFEQVASSNPVSEALAGKLYDKLIVLFEQEAQLVDKTIGDAKTTLEPLGYTFNGKKELVDFLVNVGQGLETITNKAD